VIDQVVIEMFYATLAMLITPRSGHFYSYNVNFKICFFRVQLRLLSHKSLAHLSQTCIMGQMFVLHMIIKVSVRVSIS